MRVKVAASGSTTIARGPGKFLIRNKTNTQSVFLSLANNPESGEPVPAASSSTGYEWEKTASGEDRIEVALSVEESLVGVAAVAEQELMVLQISPHF